MEFTQWMQLPPADVENGTWWRCPYCGHDGMTKESTLHLPKCPWPQLEADRLEIATLRCLASHLEGLLEECREYVLQVMEKNPSDSPVALNLLSRIHAAIGSQGHR